MRVCSWLQRKAICLGLLWGIMAAGEFPVSNVVTRWLQAPWVGLTRWGMWLGWPSPERWAYVLHILLAAAGAYALACGLEATGRRVLCWRVRTTPRRGRR